MKNERTLINNEMIVEITGKKYLDELTNKEYYSYFKESDVKKFLERDDVEVISQNIFIWFIFKNKKYGFLKTGDHYSLCH